MFRTTRLNCCVTFAWILSSFFASSTFASWCDSAFDSAFDLEPNSVWRSHEQFEENTFRWLLPSTGIATVDLLTAGSNPAWIEFLAATCDDQAAEVWIIEQSASRLVLAVRSAGHLYLESDASSAFRLVTSFTRAEVADEAFDFGSPGILAVQTSFLVAGSATKADPEIVDPEPDGSATTASLKADPEIVDPEPDGLKAGASQLTASFLTLQQARTRKADPEIVDPEPDGLKVHRPDSSNSGLRQVLVFEPLCQRTGLDGTGLDDHGDTISCATALDLGHSILGQLDNDWSDDVDVFSFHLAEVSRVAIAVTGEISNAAYQLRSQGGQRLATELLSDSGQERRLASTLSPGRYFFTLSGASGDYSITVKEID